MPAGIILDSTGKPLQARTRRLFVPNGHEDEAPIGHCWVCQMAKGVATKFYAGEEEAWQRHVGLCARANMDVIRANSPFERNRDNVFGQSQDPEAEEHLLKIGRRMVAEGRYELKRSERAALQ